MTFLKRNPGYLLGVGVVGLKYMKGFLILVGYKLYLFSNLKQNLSVESYLSISNYEYRKLITKLRISEHNLLIEKGRHLNIPREQRLCSH
jgi:hypothetical protein